jgi:hypothetical protein
MLSEMLRAGAGRCVAHPNAVQSHGKYLGQPAGQGQGRAGSSSLLISGRQFWCSDGPAGCGKRIALFIDTL